MVQKEETRKKISCSMKGHKVTEETKIKMSNSHLSEFTKTFIVLDVMLYLLESEKLIYDFLKEYSIPINEYIDYRKDIKHFKKIHTEQECNIMYWLVSEYMENNNIDFIELANKYKID